MTIDARVWTTWELVKHGYGLFVRWALATVGSGLALMYGYWAYDSYLSSEPTTEMVGSHVCKLIVDPGGKKGNACINGEPAPPYVHVHGQMGIGFLTTRNKTCNWIEINRIAQRVDLPPNEPGDQGHVFDPDVKQFFPGDHKQNWSFYRFIPNGYYSPGVYRAWSDVVYLCNPLERWLRNHMLRTDYVYFRVIPDDQPIPDDLSAMDIPKAALDLPRMQ